MFSDKRSKKVVFLAHCLLNQNSISDATADFPSQFEPLIAALMKNQIGILQLPCPELMCLGLERKDAEGGSRPVLEENSRIRRLMNTEESQGILKQAVQTTCYQIDEYLKHGFQIVGVIGINRSPSCGIETTSKDNREVSGKGVFMEMMEKELLKRSQAIPFLGIKTSQPNESMRQVIQLLKRK